jgi:hypothetical protein
MTSTNDPDEPSDGPSGRLQGRAIIAVDLVGTVVFTLAAVPAALLDESWAYTAIIIVSMVLFAIGVVAFILSYATAVERSRTDEIGAANLYVLTGDTAPPDAKRLLLGALIAQCVVGLGAAAIGFSQQSNENRLNPVAFAILVPMLGFGLNGLWAARYGRFGPRIVSEPPPRRRPRRPPDDVPPSEPEMEQNAPHG